MNAADLRVGARRANGRQKRRKALFYGLPNVQQFPNAAGSLSEIMRVRVPEHRIYWLASGMVPIIKLVDAEGAQVGHEARLAWGRLRADEDLLPEELIQLDYAPFHALPVEEQAKTDNQDALRTVVRDLQGQSVGAVPVFEREYISVFLIADREIDPTHPDFAFRWEALEEPLG